MPALPWSVPGRLSGRTTQTRQAGALEGAEEGDS